MRERPPKTSQGRLAALPTGRRNKWLVLLLWVVLFLALAPLGEKLHDVTNEEAAAWLPSGAEATQVENLRQQFRSTDNQIAVIVYERSGGITEADTAKARADLTALGRLPGAQPPQGPFPATDGKALRTLVAFSDDGMDSIDEARGIVTRGPPGLTGYVTGPAASFSEIFSTFENVEAGLLLAVGLVVIALLLVIYRSPFLWLITFFATVVALIVARSTVYLLAEHTGFTLHSQNVGVPSVLVFVVGTNYALLLVARYREELRRHADKHEAMAAALRRAGPAMAASGSAVGLGLLCLVFADVQSTAGLGPVALINVIVPLAAMTTLLPALLVTMPRGVYWPLVPRHDETRVDAVPGRGVPALVGARPRLVWAVSAAVLVVLTLGLVSLRTSGLTNEGQFVGEPDFAAGSAALARHFPAGTGEPTIVIGQAAQAGPLRSAVAGTPGVAEVSAPISRGGLAYYEATLAAAPDTDAAKQTVERLRTTVHALPGAEAKVGGLTASTLDFHVAADRDNRLLIPVALVVILLILALWLRAVIAPALMAGAVALSFAAALGGSAVAFDVGFGFADTDHGFPLLAFVLLAALGTDYAVFLVSQIRAESGRAPARQAVVRGLARTGGVVASAGVLLAAVFTAMTVMPLVIMVQIGFVVALGALLSALVVGGLLLPALCADLGRRVWWPGRPNGAERIGDPADAPSMTGSLTGR